MPRRIEQFVEEFVDIDIATLHFMHHQKRRKKYLLRLAALVQPKG
jgi:hypothetical protein